MPGQEIHSLGTPINKQHSREYNGVVMGVVSPAFQKEEKCMVGFRKGRRGGTSRQRLAGVEVQRGPECWGIVDSGGILQWTVLGGEALDSYCSLDEIASLQPFPFQQRSSTVALSQNLKHLPCLLSLPYTACPALILSSGIWLSPSSQTYSCCLEQIHVHWWYEWPLATILISFFSPAPHTHTSVLTTLQTFQPSFPSPNMLHLFLPQGLCTCRHSSQTGLCMSPFSHCSDLSSNVTSPQRLPDHPIWWSLVLLPPTHQHPPILLGPL